MTKLLRMTSAVTGRPAFIDPLQVGAITDMIEMEPSSINGAPPRLSVVGAIVIVGGQSVPIQGHAEDVARVIDAARVSATPLFTLDPAFGGLA